MSTNKEKFMKLVSDVPDSKCLEEAKYRITNRYWLRYSQRIALKILFKLDELNITKEDLAAKANIPNNRINVIVTGKANLTLLELVQIDATLDLKLFNI